MKVTTVDSWQDKQVSEEEEYVREAARVYKELEESIQFLKEEQSKLSKVLIEAEAQEYFKDGTKVEYQPGRAKNTLDEHKIIADLSYDELIKVAKIQEKDLKALTRPQDSKFGQKILEENKHKVGEGSPSVRMAKMTQSELKEHHIA